MFPPHLFASLHLTLWYLTPALSRHPPPKPHDHHGSPREAQVQAAQASCVGYCRASRPRDTRACQPRTSVQEYVFTGSALASATDQLAVNMNSISFQQAPSGIDRGRNQSFFAMNAPQGNPFAAAGALHMPFSSQLHQKPFTGQQFGPPVMTPNSLERACKMFTHT
ncbi:hypothetical protein FOXG_20799 [Fusarium oxysporum f. sp. lycopersici 4287]|uniref:Uncharacterized protein n=1 Tax=Fusarium oxysporum f. sp. lycopersici (strain 4287 / CBS 123668 / FGSC 9935 / NRRL 34936) TaxID=426428 RepID=A0A0J9VR64_FUSO4|nr:hypothetical protein FOXG_20799 [Fusarium oxysporum f. sp. lycopersici 4287]KNB13301.1 hypothetical protein FOXG_20799 [Fusarium oxysporum f. sp. lycopersici 4287]